MPSTQPATAFDTAFAELGPVAAAIAPFAFSVDQVAPSLQTGEELLSSLLAKEYTPTTPLSEFESLLQKAPVSDFEALLNQPVKSGLTTGLRVAESLSSLSETGVASLSRLIGIVGGAAVAGLQMLLYSPDAGLSNESDIVSEYLKQFGIQGPPAGTSPAGLSPIAAGSVPQAELAPLVVSASRISAPVAVSPTFGLDPFTLGDLALPGVASTVKPKTGRSPAPSPAPQPLRQAGPLTATETMPAPALGELGRPGVATLSSVSPSPIPTPNTAAQNQPDKCGKQQRQKKKKKPRTKCYKGSYVDRKHGLLKYPREQIKCQ
jgi:hypothetical protein